MPDDVGENFPLRFSLFPHVPPFVRILPPGQYYDPPLPPELAQFTWLAPAAISPIVENCVSQAGFVLVKQGGIRRKEADLTGAIWDCLPITEKAKDEINFSGLNEEVKINQFPGLFIIGRKDNLWLSYEQMMERHGEKEFGFCPKTYILPKDLDLLVSEMKTSSKFWIVKPPNWYCGIGITLIDKIDDIPQRKNMLCVQEYIQRPLLIKGLKFDLRLYILLTSIDPIRVYVYDEGLVRFATVEYSNDPKDIKNLHIHLTNYSVNKNNQDFVYNEIPGGFEGHKWNLGALWKYFEEVLKIDWRPLWEDIKDICVKTILCGHNHMRTEFRKKIKSDYSCYKLFGFDVFIDDQMKPWLLEVNNIPSLHVDTIDTYVNAPMVAEMFNIVGFHVPKTIGSKSQKVVTEKLSLKLKPGSLGHDSRVYTRLKTERDFMKQQDYTMKKNKYLDPTILDDLTPSDLRILIQSEDELSQCRHWSRSIPNAQRDYLQFVEDPSYADRLLNAWEHKYGSDQLLREDGRQLLITRCSEKHHLEIPQVAAPSCPSSGSDPAEQAGTTSRRTKTKLLDGTLFTANLSEIKERLLGEVS